ncbi:MAG TPA: phosphosulfolactate synthase, partial [Bacteroidia bacterium]|nr:phosphosulfolactate synthase [Bacteroidia bacterium]
MNFSLDQVPVRTVKPRQSGLTMVMDKGLGVRQAEDLVESSGPFVDLVKLGFGSSYITPRLEDKLAVYRNAGLPVYLGGTLLEAFIIRNKFEDYLRLIDKYKLSYAEVSDGSITLAHDQKLEYIRRLSKQVTVITEVGSKEEGIIIHPNKWIELINSELQAGAWKVI